MSAGSLAYGLNIGGMKRRTFRSVYIQPIKRKVYKKVLGTIRKMSPRRQWKNLKKRVLRRVGYYSNPAKLFRYARRHGITAAIKIGATRAMAGRK